MPIALLTVDEAARDPRTGGEDCIKVYAEVVDSADKLPMVIQGCQVRAGCRSGDQWFGCEFIVPGWPVPGFGTVYMLP